MERIVWALAASIAILVCSQVGFAQKVAIDTRFPDSEFFRRHIDLDFEGLEAVRAAMGAGDYARARRALAEYYRNRDINTWLGDPDDLGLTSKERKHYVEWGGEMLDHERMEEYWTGKYTIDWWYDPNAHRFARMYWWSALARSYIARNRDPEIARLWAGLLRSFIEQCPPPDDDRPDLYWEGLRAGIRLRDGWPLTFHVFRSCPQVTDDDIIAFLKSLIEQAEFVRRTHWPVGNKITFAMVGLYSAATAFPELQQAPAWRDYAAGTALENLDRGYLPDGMGAELSPGYHGTFNNYLRMYGRARDIGRGEVPLMQRLAAGCERLFMLYPRLAGPDRQLPRYQDSGSPNARERLAYALEYYPDNELFQWFATEGEDGTAPDFRSMALPYAGYIAMRTGWSRDANYVGFDVGPIGWGHAHQDKLNLVMWCYGRMVLMDPGHGDYGHGEFSRWAMDTFAHNTALVDNRPQRRKWGKSGGFMPDAPLTDYTFETHDNWDRASGVYDGAYGLAGPSDSYPYSEGSSFLEGWGRPATHHRRVFFLHPDIVVVSDTLMSKDGRAHEYEIRWHLDSTEILGPDDSRAVATRDAGRPNMVIAPLDTKGLTVTSASGRGDIPILGWNFYGTEPKPATTVQHTKSGHDAVRFLTLLLPVRAEETLSLAGAERVDGQAVRFRLSDGRKYEVTVPGDPARQLSVVAIRAGDE